MNKDVSFTIARLELQRGDVLVVKGSTVNYGNSYAALSQIVPPGVRILYIPPDVDLSVLTKDEIDRLPINDKV